MKLFIFIPCLIFFTILTARSVSARLYLNEIYPAPVSGEKEWVEIYNDEDQGIDLKNYTLTDLVGNKITLESSSITAKGFSLGISTSVLNNTGDTVFLKHNIDGLIEVATYSGSFSSDKTFSKCPDGIGSWYTLTTITKNFSNENACLILTPSPTITPSPTLTPSPTMTLTPTPLITPTLISTPTQSPTPTLQPTPTVLSTPGVENLTTTPQIPTIINSPTVWPTTIPSQYEEIYISEVMVNPESEEKEWVEIYNNNDFAVSLTNWYLDDLENAGSAPKNISLDINGKSYGVYELTSSIFNNDGDQIRLLDFNKNLKDSSEYSSSTQGKTWGRTDFENDNFCLQEPSKNSTNNSCINPTAETDSTTEPTKKISPTTIYQAPISKKSISKQPSILYPPPSIFVYRSSTIYHPSSNIETSQILGVNTNKKFQTSSSNKTKGLSFISFFYSLLTIASVLIKMKVNA